MLVGLTLGVLSRVSRPDLRRHVWLGTGVAASASLVIAAALQRVGFEFGGKSEKIFEGATMLLAAGVLTWMILWMRARSRQVQAGLEADIHRAAGPGRPGAVFSIAFLAVFREGVELALFLTAATFQVDAAATLFGGLLGLATAMALGYLLYGTSIRLDLRAFFQVSGLLLLLFAAGLVGHAVHEFNDLGWIPPLMDPIWNLSVWLREDSLLGSLLKSLFGYNAEPSLTEALAYVSYLVVLVFVWRGVAPHTRLAA